MVKFSSVLFATGWEVGVKTGRIEEHASQFGELGQIKAGAQGFAEVLVGDGILLAV